MSTLQTVQGAGTVSSPSPTPHSADEADALHSIVQESTQNTASITRLAQGVPTPAPAVPLPLQGDVKAANDASATLTQTVAAALVGQEPPEATDAHAAAPATHAAAPQLDPILDQVLQQYIYLAEHPLPIEGRISRDVQQCLDKVQHLQEALHNVPDEIDVAFLQADLAQLEEHLQDDLHSIRMADRLQVTLFAPLQGESAEQKLEMLINFLPMLEGLEQGEGGEKGILPPEIQSLQSLAGNQIIHAVSLKDASVAAYLSGLSKGTLSGLETLVFQAGEDAPEMLQALATAHEALRKSLPADKASAQLDQLINTMLRAETPAQRLDSVDSLLQHCYPSNPDLPLLIKHLVVKDAELRLGVEAQHALSLGLHALVNGPDTSRARSVLSRTAQTEAPRQLTPEMVKDITHKSAGKINYHLAHMVLLQSTAEAFGCLPPLLSPDAKALKTPAAPPAPLPEMENLHSEAMAQTLSDAAATQWLRALGMDADTATYAAERAPNAQEAQESRQVLDHLIEASQYYQQGISGSDAASKVAHALVKVGSMTTHRHSERHALALYSSNAAVSARLALDRYLVGLSGLSATDRLLDADEGLAFNAAVIDQKITDRISTTLAAAGKRGKAALNALQGLTNTGMSEQLSQRHSNLLNSLHGHRHAFVSHYTLAQDLFRETIPQEEAENDVQNNIPPRDALLQARAARAQAKAERMENKSIRRMMGHNWPHLRAQRKEAYKLVLEVDALRNEAVEPGSAKAAQNEEKMKDLLKKLGKFDPCTFTRVKHGQAVAAQNLDDVLKIMLPRAKALEYFSGNGVLKYQLQRRTTFDELNELRREEFAFRQKVSDAYGKGIFRLVRGAVEAAALGAFLDARCTPSEFVMTEKDNVDRVMDQLKKWGLEAKRDDAVLVPLVYRALHKATHADGTLNFAKLRKHGESLSRDLVSTDLRKNGKSPNPYLMEGELAPENTKLGPLAAHKEAKKLVLHSADEATRKEGVHGLMENVKPSGSGLIIDRTRGVQVDTGARFSPLGHRRVSKRSVRFPLSVQLQLMHSNSLAVIHTKDGYQVLLKDKIMAGAAFNATVGLGGPLKLMLSGGGSGEKMEGLALDFTRAEDCERFLVDFMDPASDLHSKDKALTTLRHADQIRFVSGDGGTIQGSVGISAGLLNIPLSEKLVATASVSASVAGKRSYSNETRYNALGQTITMSTTHMLSASVGAGIGLLNTDRQTLRAGGPLSVNRSATYDETERYKVDTGPRGVTAKTCLEREYAGTAVSQLFFLNALPADVHQRVLNDKTLMDKLSRIAEEATPATRVTIHRDITPKALKDVAELQRQASLDTSRAAVQAHEKAHALLVDEHSYGPACLMVHHMHSDKLGKGISPSILWAEVTRRDTLTQTSTEVIVLPGA